MEFNTVQNVFYKKLKIFIKNYKVNGIFYITKLLFVKYS